MTSGFALPVLRDQDAFDENVVNLGRYFVHAVDSEHSFEELQKDLYETCLRPLVDHIVRGTQCTTVVSALLVLRGHFASVQSDDDRGENLTRALACELVAWRFLTHLTERDALEHLCVELSTTTQTTADLDERTALLDGAAMTAQPGPIHHDRGAETSKEERSDHFAVTYQGLNALEIAIVTDSKKFVSQTAVQRIVNGIWRGDIVFWSSLNPQTMKRAAFYNEKRSDPFCRLRVPLYLKTFEVLFFAVFLALYYAVLVRKPLDKVYPEEIGLYIWLAAFAYNELGEFLDTGLRFYTSDFWSIWDLGIIATGLAFFVLRIIGLARDSHRMVDTAFDVLAMEALFLIPRICSLLSLQPYFGTLLPCLKEMTKDFIKFAGLVAILYLGFNTCFIFLARGTFSFNKMSWILVKVFFGSSYLGFDVAEQISPVLGPPLMFIFVCLTNLLLITALISLLSNSITNVISHARDEYLFVYAVYVLEASASNRLTYFYPPMNLLPLILRPLRLFFTSESLRVARIVLLKATHWPVVGLILAFERARAYIADLLRANPSSASSLSTIGGQKSSTLPRRPVSDVAMQKMLVSHQRRQSPLVDEPRIALISTSRVSTTAGADLKNIIAEMRSAIDRLSARLPSEEEATVGAS